MKFCYLFFLLIYLSPFLTAQNNWIIYDSTNSPLQNNLIRVVESDSYGNIWLGTNNGLYKYDGVFWTNYTTDNSPIPYDQVDNFYLDKNDNIWFMTGPSSNPYFVKYDNQYWETVDSNQTCFPDNSYLPRNFVVNGGGSKWVHSNGYIIKYDGENCNYYEEQNVGIVTTDINKIDIDINDNFFFVSQSYEFGHNGGIAEYTSSGWTYNPLSGNGWPIDFTIDPEFNLIWISTFNSGIGKGNLVKLTYDSLQFLTSFDYYNPLQQGLKVGKYLIDDMNGNVWQSYLEAQSGFVNLGLICFVKDSDSWILYNNENSQLPSNSINGIAVDLSNDKLIATDKGLAIYNENGIIRPEQLTLTDTTDFGEIEIGNSNSKELMLYNHSGIDLIIDSLTFANGIYSSNNILPVVISAGDSGSIFINFTPDTAGIYFNKLFISTSSGVYVQMLYGKGKLPVGIVQQKQTLSFYLSNNYPDPFNPTTRINYQIPEISKVKLAVYNMLGSEIKVLVNVEKPAGTYEVEFDGTELPSGVYFYRIEAGKYSNTKKLLLLK